MKTSLPEICIRQKNGVAVVSSLDVAEKFGKRHDDVLRTIRCLIKKCPNASCLFSISFYENAQGKKQPLFEMQLKGFITLVSGFNCKPAVHWRMKYSDAFLFAQK